MPQEDAQGSAPDVLDGTVTYSYDDYSTGSLQHYGSSYGWNDYGEASAGFMPLMVDYQVQRGQLTLSDVGKRQTKYHWQRNTDPITGLPDPNDNPPDFLILKVTAGAEGDVCSDISNLSNDNSDASVTVSLMGQSGGSDTSWTRVDGARFKALSQTASKLYAIPTNGQEDVSGPWVNYGVEIQMDGDRYISPDTNLIGEASVDLSYNPSIDNRTVQISSSTIEPSKHKGSNNTPEDNVRNADGSMSVDSVVQWGHPGTNETLNFWNVDDSFNCTALNFDAGSTYQWERTGDGDVYAGAGVGDVSTQAIKDIILKLQLGPADATSNPDLISDYEGGTKSTTLKVHVTDPTDGAVGTAQYDIKWHLPAEDVQEEEDKRVLDTDIKIIEPDVFQDGDFALDGGTLNCDFWYRKEYWLANRDINDYAVPVVKALLSNVAETPLELVLMQAVGNTLTIPDDGLPEETNCANNQEAWDESQLLTDNGVRACIPDPPSGEPAYQWEECEMYYPLLSVHYDDHFLNYDAYGQNGYLGRKGKWERLPSSTSPKYAGDYRPKSPPDNGP